MPSQALAPAVSDADNIYVYILDEFSHRISTAAVVLDFSSLFYLNQIKDKPAKPRKQVLEASVGGSAGEVKRITQQLLSALLRFENR